MAAFAGCKSQPFVKHFGTNTNLLTLGSNHRKTAVQHSHEMQSAVLSHSTSLASSALSQRSGRASLACRATQHSCRCPANETHPAERHDQSSHQQQQQQQEQQQQQHQLWMHTSALPTAALTAACVAAACLQPSAASAALSLHEEPSNALSLPTWAIHVSSVTEWVAAMVLMWRYADVSGNQAWKGMTWGMMPCLGSAMAACTWHFFYNSPDLDFLVALQAFLTVVGNITCWVAAYRIYAAAQTGGQPSS